MPWHVHTEAEKYEIEQVLLHCTRDAVRCTQCLISGCKNLLSWLGQISQSEEGWSDLLSPRWGTFVMAATERVIECHNSWQPKWQLGRAPAGETCLETRISEGERSTEIFQNESHSSWQVALLGSKIHVQIHRCNLVPLWGETETVHWILYKSHKVIKVGHTIICPFRLFLVFFAYLPHLYISDHQFWYKIVITGVNTKYRFYDFFI